MGARRSSGIAGPAPPPIRILPTTDLGRWAVGLSFAFIALVLAGAVVPRGAAVGLVWGAAGGVAALVAIVRDRDRAPTVFGALVPLAIAVAFALAELLGGNPLSSPRAVETALSPAAGLSCECPIDNPLDR